MKPAGLKAIELAKQDGRWDVAYDSQKTISVPDDFQAALDRNKKAKTFFAALNSSNRYSFCLEYRLPGNQRLAPNAFVNLWKCWKGARNFIRKKELNYERIS
jgi:hypothetical protein